MKPMRAVKVQWRDAWASEKDYRHESVDSLHGPVLQNTIGWVVRDDDQGIMLTPEYGDEVGLTDSIEERQYRGLQFIPRGMIVKVTRV